MRSLSITSKRLNRLVDQYCSTDKTSIVNLCLRGDLLIIYKRNLFVDNVDTFGLVCGRGYINLVRKTIEVENFGEKDLNYGLKRACQGNAQNVVWLIIDCLNALECFAEWGECVVESCRGGHLEAINMMLSILSTDQYIHDWNQGFYEACYHGHHKIIHTLIDNKVIGDERFGLYGACAGGRRETVDLIISLLTDNAIDWNIGLAGARRGGHLEIINLMSSLLSDNDLNESSNNELNDRLSDNELNDGLSDNDLNNNTDLEEIVSRKFDFF